MVAANHSRKVHSSEAGIHPRLEQLLARYGTAAWRNPLHAPTVEAFRLLEPMLGAVDIPKQKILCPGVIDSTSNYVEHPRLVAQRLRQFARIVGADRVMGGSDCGFGTFAGDGLVEAEVAFAKLNALAKGAEIARKAA